MKTIYYTAWSLLLTVSGFAQLPQGMTFQAVIYSDENQLMRDSAIGVRFSILQGEELIYAERHQPMTNSNGHIALIIGTGTAELGTYSDIPWEKGNMRLRREYDVKGGTDYKIMGEEFLHAVPYALMAERSKPTYLLDINGQFIPTVVLDTLEWMAANLSVTHYNDGSAIGASDVFVYDSDASNIPAYGRLYSWNAVASGQLCPMGWRVPSKEEWMNLLDANETSALRVPEPAWVGHANNQSGLSIKAGGLTDGVGNFSGKGALGYYWTGTASGGNNAWSIGFTPGTGNPLIEENYDQTYGMSVRCVR
jgi:uncharacterized protein (TIGR02145 family)